MKLEEPPEMTPFQEFLFQKYAEFAEMRHKIRPTTSEFARYLHVKHTSLDHWLGGGREPDLANAVILAKKLGPRVYELLGFPPLYEIRDPKLLFIFNLWEDLDDETRGRIDDIITGGQKTTQRE